MEYAYRADAWQALYATVGGSVATLTGLLFIGLSLNLRTIVRVPMHRARAREAFGGLLSLLVLSLLMLIPGQDRHVLGSELIVGTLVVATVAMTLQFQTLQKLTPQRRVRWVLRLLLLYLGFATSLFAGISLIAGEFGGLFWLLPTILIYLLWSLNNVWLLVVEAAEEGEQ